MAIRGFCVVMGQNVPIDRARVRTTDDQEVRLGPSGWNANSSKANPTMRAYCDGLNGE